MAFSIPSNPFKPDAVISNRDDVLFIDRLKQSNKGMTYITSSTTGGHVGIKHV